MKYNVNRKKALRGILAGIAILVAIFFILKSCHKESSSISFDTATASIGSVSNTVTATGTVQAVQTVSVGTQVSGVISKLYVDYNSHVKKGQLLAVLDRRALLISLESAKSTYDNALAEIKYQASNFKRIKALYDKKMIAKSDYDQALYTYEKAKASLKGALSEYSKAKINLGYAYITSPIDGVILNRVVEEGQTVAASFSTPTLFSIANDLTQMKIEVSVDEADIGLVKKGQQVNFTVDAFPDMEFTGTVTQIRLQSVTTSNVVTYTVIVNAPNPQKKLMPGMTANVTIVVANANNALVIPSKALHFTPTRAALNNWTKNTGSKPITFIPQSTTENQIVWVKRGNNICPVKVSVGIDDDIHAEIRSGLEQGDLVITSINASATQTKSSSDTASSGSPFMPTPPKKGKH